MYTCIDNHMMSIIRFWSPCMHSQSSSANVSLLSSLQNVEKDIARRDPKYQYGRRVKVQFQENEISFTLPNCSDSGWTMTPLTKCLVISE